MDDFEREMKVCFLDEASQLLEDAEQNFMALEASPDDIKVVENLFRLAHNLKGGARAVGFSEMAEFTHVLESLLLKLKNREILVHPSTVTLLLECNDHLKNSIQSLRADFDYKIDSKDLLAKITSQMENPASAAAESVAQPTSNESPGESLPVEAEASPELLAQEGAETTPSEGPSENTLALELETARKIAEQFEEAETESPTAKEAKPIAAEAPPAPAPSLAPIQQASKPQNEAAPQGQPPAKKNAAAEDESIRVSLKRLEGLINNVGELVILQTVLNQQKYHIQSALVHRTVNQLAKITKDIQDISMSLRMVPLKQTFQKMQRIVRDTAQALKKDIKFVTEGEQTEIDKTVVDLLGDPLVHLVRNAVDHGIENEADRQKVGKSGGGTITLSAYHRGGQIVIDVQDDGKGLDAEILKTKAIEKGIIRPHEKLSDQDCYHLIFAPGFSTKSDVSEISGRGVGMDVVKTNIEKKLSGEVELITEKGKGTTVRIRLPLTLAIIDGMVLSAGSERYVVPLAQVFESLQPAKEDIHAVSGLGEVLSIRGEHLPVFRLSELVGKREEKREAWKCIAVVVRSGDLPFCVLVDDILGQQQIVIKQLGGEIRDLKGVSGGAILGDGRAALILDLNELVLHKGTPSGKRSVA